MKAGGLVAVTGASGYIGRHFLRHQARKGQSVIAVVRRSLDLPDARDVRVADVTDWEALVRAFAGCDAVVHLACLPVARCQQDPTAGFRVNTLGTFYVLMAAREAGVRRVVYTSSAQVYGRPAVRPVPESAPCQPVTMYGASKLCGEVWCRTLARAGGPETVVLRLFNAYGPAADRTPRPTVETLFLRAVLAGQEPVVRGHPEHMRDFVHVSDVVRALDLALTTHWAAGQPINIGAGRGVTMIELAEIVVQLLGSDLRPQVEPPSEDPIRLEADITRASLWLGWAPRVTLEEGLLAMMEASRKA